MNKITFAIICVLFATVARATDVATTQAYVDSAAAELQGNLPAKTSDKVVTYTTTAGTTGEREIRTELGNESTNQSDTGIPTAGTVKTAVGDKQKKDYISPLSGTNIVTYTGTTPNQYSFSGPGVVATTPIYDDTVNTFDNGLVTAKTLNDAVIAGVEAEVTKIQTPKGALWRINRTAPKVLPTTANLVTDQQGIGFCYRRVQTSTARPQETFSGAVGCSTPVNRGDWGTTFSFNTGITYDTTCRGTYCGKEVRGISACSNARYSTVTATPVPQTETTLISKLETAYENGKTGATPNGRYCYCKLVAPVVPGSRWVYSYAYVDATDCAVGCVEFCAGRVQDYSTQRSAIFSAAPVPVATTPTE